MRRRRGIVARVHEHEAAGAIGGLPFARDVTALSVERRLLVAGDAADLRAAHRAARPPRPPRRSERFAAAAPGRRRRARAARRPSRASASEASMRARSVRRIGHVHCAVRELPDEPGVDGAERKVVAAVLAQEPLELGRGEVRIGDQSGALARIRSVSSSRQRSAVRRSCQTIAGATGRPVERSQSNVVSRWFVMAIVSTSSSPARAAASRTLCQISSGSCSTQPGRGKCWGTSRVAAPVDVQLLVDDEARRAGRALVDREDHGRRLRMPGDERERSLPGVL